MKLTPEEFQARIHEGGFSHPRDPDARHTRLTTLRYHMRFAGAMVHGSRAAKRAPTDAAAQREAMNTSVDVFNAIFAVGGGCEVTGFERARDYFGKPAVYVANHMSALETYLLPGILLALGDFSIVLKASLLNIPCIGTILRASRPIALLRQEPRKDLLQVLEDGQRLLGEGRGIVLFPQGTRFHDFEARRFNTLGEKLSARANVPLIPVAVDTRFQRLGKHFHDFGPIHPECTVRVACGDPVPPGALPPKERNAACIKFITERLHDWGVPVTVSPPGAPAVKGDAE